ncbi:DNA damage-inducible transcript 3 protein [Stigmatopora nigra]
MTAEWLHLPPPYPPGVGPLCGAELEAWYEDLQDILGSDAGGAKMARAPSCGEKEPEFLDVLESCSLTWLTEGSQTWGEGVQRATDQVHIQPLHHTSSNSTGTEERKMETGGRSGDGDLLPPEFFEFLSEGGMVDSSNSYYYHHHNHNHHQNHNQQVDNIPPASPSASEEELPCVPDSPSSSSSSASPSPPPQRCLSPSSPSGHSPSLLGKRRRTSGPETSSHSAPSRSQRCASSSSACLSAKKSRKEREQENEKKVQELTEQNERLKAEIERLGEEVQRTRRALIERLVNTRK